MLRTDAADLLADDDDDALVDELDRAQRAMTGADRAALVAAGVPLAPIAMLVGVAEIELDRSGTTYQPVDGGPRAFVIPVRVGPDDQMEQIDYDLVPWFGDLVDVVAISIRHAGRWALRRGSATWLGAIGPQYCDPPLVPVRRSPLSWLRAGCVGICPLSRNTSEVQALLVRCRSIGAEDAAHARELRRLLERPLAAPRVVVAARCKELV